MPMGLADVPVPAANMLAGEGSGFEISQLRLGPVHTHRCMRAGGGGEKPRR
jgi:acyl-CoA dehydrogenase